ncbi:MAG: S8 family serine peptidase [Acidimicrobiales bacterium]|nr:S8 family serine peptidase [Acidimicrobiales bacterium]
MPRTTSSRAGTTLTWRRAALGTALLAVATLLLPAAVGAQPAPADAPRGPTPTIEPGVRAAVERGERARVIVELTAPAPALVTGRAADAAERTLDASRTGIAEALPTADAASIQTVDGWPFVAMEVSADGLAALAARPDVRSITPNGASAPSLTQSIPLIGGDDAAALGYTGAGQTVAVLDTGVQTDHPFLAGRTVAEACFTTDNGAGIVGQCPGPDVTEATGPGTGAPCPLASKCTHGTHVAGIAVGSGVGIRGVAPEANLISIQVFSRFDAGCGTESPPCVRVTDFDLIRAFAFVYDLRDTHDIASVNLSLGGFPLPSWCDFDGRKPMIDAMRAAGIATVVASGNDGAKDGIQMPACISSTISVGATDVADNVAGFSNSAPHLAMLAPGVGTNSSVPGGGFGTKSGTSMATPHVAGAFAVLAQQHPDATVDELVGLLRGTGVPVRDGANGVVTPRLALDRATRPPTFHLREPVRVLDTRDGTGSGVAAPVGPGGWVDLDVAPATGLPVGEVTSVLVNLTAVGASTPTHLTMWGAGFPEPATSSINVLGGETRANAVVARVGPDGTVRVRNNSGSVHVVVDLFGAWDAGGDAATGLRYDAARLPVRVLDTRTGTGSGAAAPIGPGGSATFDVATACPQPGAVAAVVNLTGTGAGASTHLTVHAATSPLPGTSNLNLTPGHNVPNGVTSLIGTDGKLAVFNNAGATDAVADLQGCWYATAASPEAGRFVPADPTRVLDTRTGLGTPAVGPLVGPGGLTVEVQGNHSGVPRAGIDAVVLNVTALNAAETHHLTVAPTGLSLDEVFAVLNTSVVNYEPGRATANLVIAPVGPDGKVTLGLTQGQVDVVVDVVGWLTA